MGKINNLYWLQISIKKLMVLTVLYGNKMFMLGMAMKDHG